MADGGTPKKENNKRKHQTVVITPPKILGDRSTTGVTTYYHKKSRSLSTAPITVEEGMDILKLTKKSDNETAIMMFYMNTNYPGDIKPPMTISYIDGGVHIDLKEIDMDNALKIYGENMEKIIFDNDTLLNKAYNMYNKKCVNYMKKAIQDTVDKHNKDKVPEGQARIYGCFLYTDNKKWTGMINGTNDDIAALNRLYRTEIDDGYPTMNKKEMADFFIETIATERDQ
jgi:hypothetical protein